MNNEKKKSPSRLLMGSFIVLLISTIILSGLCTDWGKVKITRVNLEAHDGQTVSAIMYVPESATSEAPAPAAILLHGRSNSAHVTHTWATEMARRGYVVIAPDMQGGGESDNIPGNMLEDLTYQDIMWDYLQMTEFVDHDAIFFGGFSAGAAKAYLAGNKYADEGCAGIISCAAVFVPEAPYNTNLLVLKAQNDQYNSAFGCGPRDVYEKTLAENLELPTDSAVSGEIYGSVEDKTAVQYVFLPTIIHQMSDVTPTGISAMVDFMNMVAPAPNMIDSSSTVWQWQQFMSLIAVLAFIGCICGLGKVLLCIPWFREDIVNPLPTNKGARGAKYAFSALLAFAIPALIFIPVSARGMSGIFEHNPILRSKNLNGVMAALITVQLITICIMAVKYYMKKKAGVKVTLSDYAIAPEGSGINWKGVGKSFMLAMIVVVVAFVWLYFVEEFGGTNYQCWRVIVVNRFNIHRMAATIPYIICIFIILFVSGIGMNTERRLDDKNSLLKCMIINALIAASGVGFLLLVQYGGSILSGTGQAVFAQQSTGAVGGTSVGALDFAVGFPFIIGTMAAINTYFFRKSGNIWTGTFIGAVLAASMAVTQFTFSF